MQFHCSFCYLNACLKLILRTGEVCIYRDDKTEEENNQTLTALTCSRNISHVNDGLKSKDAETCSAPIIRVDVVRSSKSL